MEQESKRFVVKENPKKVAQVQVSERPKKAVDQLPVHSNSSTYTNGIITSPEDGGFDKFEDDLTDELGINEDEKSFLLED